MVTLLPRDTPDASDYGSCRRSDWVRVGKHLSHRTGIRDAPLAASLTTRWWAMWLAVKSRSAVCRGTAPFTIPPMFGE